MKIMKPHLLMLVLAPLLIAGCTEQPEPGYLNGTFYLTGHVYGETGRPVQYAFVEASCKDGDEQWDRFCYTDSDGFFQLQ